jgi:chemotaxis protein histidine kinase CheA
MNSYRRRIPPLAIGATAIVVYLNGIPCQSQHQPYAARDWTNNAMNNFFNGPRHRIRQHRRRIQDATEETDEWKSLHEEFRERELKKKPPNKLSKDEKKQNAQTVNSGSKNEKKQPDESLSKKEKKQREGGETYEESLSKKEKKAADNKPQSTNKLTEEEKKQNKAKPASYESTLSKKEKKEKNVSGHNKAKPSSESKLTKEEKKQSSTNSKSFTANGPKEKNNVKDIINGLERDNSSPKKSKPNAKKDNDGKKEKKDKDKKDKDKHPKNDPEESEEDQGWWGDDYHDNDDGEICICEDDNDDWWGDDYHRLLEEESFDSPVTREDLISDSLQSADKYPRYRSLFNFLGIASKGATTQNNMTTLAQHYFVDDEKGSKSGKSEDVTHHMKKGSKSQKESSKYGKIDHGGKSDKSSKSSKHCKCRPTQKPTQRPTSKPSVSSKTDKPVHNIVPKPTTRSPSK